MYNMTLCMRSWCEVRNFASQKFRFNWILYTFHLCPVCCCSDCSLRSALWVAWLSALCSAEVSMHRTGLDIVLDARILAIFWIRIGFGYLFLKNMDQDICLISVTKFSWKWFKMSQRNDWWCFFCFICYDFYSLFTKKSKWFCQYVVHSSQSMIIRVTLS